MIHASAKMIRIVIAGVAIAAVTFAPLQVEGQDSGSFGGSSYGGYSSARVMEEDVQGSNDDVSDLIGLSSSRMGRLAKTDVDRTLDRISQRKRMHACLITARKWMEERNDELETAVSQLLAQNAAAPASGMPEITEEQATNQLIFSMVLACYQDIDSESVSLVHDGAHLSKQKQDDVFKQWTTAPRPSKRQFKLFESVMKEEQAKVFESMGPETMPGAYLSIGRNMSTRTSIVYVLAVFACFLGAGAWATKRVLRGRPVRQLSSKAMRKVLKAEIRLAKKAH